ncbi:tripartite motif-containing protein 2-like [Physella acuta]|uniref:tripartite motif-containing protein 2-like n=1 Tax=Physella acuta TaxID=109671 RepID=UPI0027DBF18E|nr:tripartite motif-containing protein 2-like [Physella acuta]XP_059142960.1 tripartite motif-containing protein 2-like [Physella acuta]XP_059143032.1 tripartite motif-containing protein 2-like [Physella acuta]XP_059143106.1 tripartite motif-containing protein 2-like [Physella acuta]XP_059143191.1 tripartite motif-containing protein 2-like [Physella acuta]
MTAVTMTAARPVSHFTNINLLSCAICNKRYKDPKVLPCLHTFCELCLSDVIPSESLSVTCPVCKQQSILPLDGVSALQTNGFILNLLKVITSPDLCTACGGATSRPTSRCLDCQEYLCDTCSVKHMNMDNTNNNVQEHIHVQAESSVDFNGGSGLVGRHPRDSPSPAGRQGEDRPSPVERRGGDSPSQHHLVPLETGSKSVSGSLTNGHKKDEGGGVDVETIVCPNHAGSSLKYYCSLCDTAVCEACTQVEHIGHETVVLSEAVTEHKTSLTSLVSRVRLMTPEVEKAIEEVDNTQKQLLANTRDAEVKIKHLFDELSFLIEERKQCVIDELAKVSAAKEKVLEEQKKSLHDYLSRISSSCQLTENSLKHGNDTDVVLVKKEMAGKLSDLLASGVSLQPDTNPLAFFDERDFEGFKENITGLGCVCNNSAIPHHTTVGGEAFSGCVAGKASTVTVTTRDRNGDLVKTGFAPITATISTDKSEDRLTPTITDHQNGTYDLTFVLQAPGVYYLSVCMFGQHTKGSPYKIRAVDIGEFLGNGSSRVPRTMAVKQKGVKRPSSSRSQGSSNRRTNRIEDDLIIRIGVKGRNKGEFSNPQGLCYYEEKVLVADSNNQAVQVFAPSGECRLKFGTPGRAPGKIQRPTGVAATQNGNYLVADYDNKWISVFSQDGKYISRIGIGKLQGPKGVVVDKEGRIIVVDNKSSCILVFQSNGKLLHKFGSRGNRDDQFAGPHYAAINDNNDIIVTDFHNHCVKVFDRDGVFKFCFGSNGEGNGQFNAPTGVAVDEKGNIIVADWGNSRIQVFDSTGSFLSYVNTASEPLYGPQGLAVTTQGILVVADSGNHCIKYYKYLQ